MSDSKLKKSLNTWQLTLYGVGTMMGAGIYVLVGKVAGISGMLTPFAFFLAAILACFTGFSYAELSSRFPKSGGEVVFLKKAFNIQFFSSLIGFLVVLTGVVSAATITRGFVGYLQVFLDVSNEAAILGALLLLFLIAIWGISESLNIVGFITLIEVAGLIIVIALSGKSLSTFPERLPEMIPAFSLENMEMVFAGSFLAFFAFVGFEDIANVAEEVKDPHRAIPRSITISLVLTTVLYILVSIVAVLALPQEVLRSTEAPLAEVLALRGGNYRLLISAISVVAVINGALAQIIMSSRVLFGMAEEGLAPSFFGKVTARSQVPLRSTAIVSLVILTLAMWFPLIHLAEATSFIILLVFTGVNLSLIRIKRQEPHPEDVTLVPTWVPVLGALFSLVFLVVKTLSMILH